MEFVTRQVTKALMVAACAIAITHTQAQAITADEFIPRLREHFAQYFDKDGKNTVASPHLAYLSKHYDEVKENFKCSMPANTFWCRLSGRSSNADQKFYDHLFPIYTRVIEREIDMIKQGYVVFYHAHDRGYLPLQDIKKIIEEDKGVHVPEDFHYIRQEIDTNFLNSDLPNFLGEHSEKLNDNMYPYRTMLLSANQSLFHNNAALGESTAYFFTLCGSMDSLSSLPLLQKIMTLAPPSVLPVLNDAVDKYVSIKAELHTLMQIFVPEHLALKIAYDSMPFGMPVCYPNRHTVPDSRFCNDQCHKKFLSNLQKSYTGSHVGFNVYDDYNLRKKVYLQTRLYLKPEIFMNPQSGIKIFRYTDDSEATKTYFAQIDEVRKQLKAERDARLQAERDEKEKKRQQEIKTAACQAIALAGMPMMAYGYSAFKKKSWPFSQKPFSTAAPFQGTRWQAFRSKVSTFNSGLRSKLTLRPLVARAMHMIKGMVK